MTETDDLDILPEEGVSLVLSAEDRPLTPQMLRFVEEYVSDPSSVTKAAKRAGYSLQTASEAGSRLMADKRIKRAIQIAQDTRSESIGLSKERILQELIKIAFAEAGTQIRMTEDGDIDLASLKGTTGEVIVSAVSGKNKAKSTSFKTVKIADKVSALVKLGQHLGMFKEQLEVSGKVSLADLIMDSYESSESEPEKSPA